MENLLEVGKIVNTHGLRGEVKVVPWTDYPEDFEDLERVYLKTRTETVELTVKTVKYQKNNLIVKFSEFNDINEVEKYKNCILLADRSELGELPEGVHYIVDLIGLNVIDESGERIGELTDVFNTGANDVYDVKRDGKKNLLLPVIDDVVKEINIEDGYIRVHVMDGLDDEI